MVFNEASYRKWAHLLAMKNFIQKSWIFLLLFCFTSTAGLAADKDQSVPTRRIVIDQPTEDEGYTINFSDVSITEFISFVSKIANVNFIYKDDELDFNVSVVSDDPTNSTYVVSVLIQVLRANGFEVLEQHGNLVITKTTGGAKLATVVSEELPFRGGPVPAIVTRIFKIENANPAQLGALIQPMLSTAALVEVSPTSRHLIVTDVTGNVDKIADVMLTLDAPQSAFDIDAYKVLESNPDELVAYAQRIITPVAEGNPVIMVPQAHSNTIFVVSTPYLVERTMAILADLDNPTDINGKQLSSDFLMYHPKYRSGEELLTSMQDLAKSLESSQLYDPSFLRAVESGKWVPSTNSLVFTGNPESLQRIQAMLEVMDSSTAVAAGRDVLFVYKIQKVAHEQIEQGLENFASKLDSTDPTTRAIKQTIDTMRYLPESNSLVFKGPPAAIEKIKEMLTMLDGEGSRLISQKTYSVYKCQNIQGNVLIDDLEGVAKNLKLSGVNNAAVIEAINSIEWIKSTNSLLITGTQATIEQVVALCEKFDVPRGTTAASEFYMYKPVHKSAQDIRDALLNISEDLEKSGLANPNLINTITTMRYVESTQSLLFTGTPDSISEIKLLLQTIDNGVGVAGVQTIGDVTFLIYKIKNASGPQLLASLKALTGDLQKANADPELIKTLSRARYIQETNSIMFTGPPEALQKADRLAERFDIPSLGGGVAERPSPDTFKIYKPRCLAGEELIHVMDDFEQNLIDSGVTRPSLFDTINNLKYIEKTNSLLVSGEADAVGEVMDLLQRFDVPGALSLSEVPPLEPFDDVSFLIYKLHYHQGTLIVESLKQIAAELQTSASSQGGANAKLIDAINSIQWLQVTNSLIGTGEPSTLAKLKELIQNIDIPLRQIFIEVLVIETEIGDQLDFGLTWASQGKITDRIGYATGSFPQNASIDNAANGGLASTFGDSIRAISSTRTPTGSDIPFASGFDMGIIGDLIFHKGRTFAALGALINALKGDLDTTIVLNQKIITQDARNSTIFVGDNIPFTGSTVQTVGNSSQQTTANLEYRDIGFNLSITPNIGDNNLITLEIDTEISETVGETPDTSTLQGITTSKTTTTTRVHIPDKAFLVLSGQVRNQTARAKTSIPCLGSLPVVGAAFSRVNNLKDNKSVMIFLKPIIVDDLDTYKMITERQEDICLQEGVADDVEAGFELVKTPEDEE